jgi:hypothetical protein
VKESIERQQDLREQRRMADLVFLDNSPTSITDYRPDATWSVKNYNSQPTSGVWVKTTTSDGQTIVWKIGDVGGCEVKGIENTTAYGSPAFVYFADPDGLRWSRLTRTRESSGEDMHAPQRSNEKGPGSEWQDNSAGSASLENCPR